MPNTYTQLYTHFVFAVQNRISLINRQWQDDLYKYITGIVETHDNKLYAINGMPDHVHILAGMNPKQSPSDLMFHVKRSSSLWINDNRLVRGKFSWQEGFGAFSLNKAQAPVTAGYIMNQQKHHQKKTFLMEYKEFLVESGISFDEKYLFQEVEAEG